MAANEITFSPVRNLWGYNMGSFYPYGNTTAVNVLEYFLGTPEIVTNVLFLGRGDMRNALFTASNLTPAYKKLNFHFSDDSEIIIARNILITHILLSNDFSSTNPTDLAYLWDVWYSAQWSEATRRRFMKDVKELLGRQWNALDKKIVVLDVNHVQKLKNVFNSWLEMSQSMTPKSVASIIKQRAEYIAECVNAENSIGAEQMGGRSTLLGTDAALLHLSRTITRRIHVTLPGNMQPSSIAEEISNFIKTGNLEKVSANPVFINPTLLTVQTKRWEVYHLACPFEGYFPVTFREHLAKCDFGHSPYRYAKAKLQSLVSEFQSRKKRLTFHFHLADCMEQCLTNESLKNHFQVIHCSDLVDRLGLANVLYVATGCLVDSPDAALVTDTQAWLILLKPTIAEFVETSLCCPLSMIPTLYGLRLANHLKFGNLCNPVYVNFNGVSENIITLKWHKIQFRYSDNIPLLLSPEMKKSTIELARVSFVKVNLWHPIMRSFPLPYSPLTLFYTLQSLVNRYCLTTDAVQDLFQLNVPQSFLLAWKTLSEWMQGEETLQFSTDPLILPLKNRSIEALWFLLVSQEDMSRYRDSGDKIRPEVFFANSHYICNLLCKTNTLRGCPIDSVSFLLAKDHGLDLSTTYLCIIDVSKSELLFEVYLSWLTEPKAVFNLNSLLIKSRQLKQECKTGLQVLSCIESKDQYVLNIDIIGVTLPSANELNITTDRKHPSFSAHQITLKIPNAPPLVLEVPWPILAEEIQPSITEKKKQKSIQLILQKGVNDPWPSEFGGRSKWDVDLLKPWVDIEGHGQLHLHLQAQFSFEHLKLEKEYLVPTSTSTLHEVREIVRAIFFGFFNRKLYLFAIHDQQNSDPAFYIRVHTTVRFSPLGTPLLYISVIDFKFDDELIQQGKLSAKQSKADFQRVIVEGVSREVCTIRTSSSEEIIMLRYLLRLNSTKMRRSAWQSKNLPRDESSPWLSTFVSPLYVEDMGNSLDVISYLSQNYSQSRPSRSGLFVSCASCSVKKVSLLQCSRCKSVSYCSSLCQKNDWNKHKPFCVEAEGKKSSKR